MSSFKNRFGKIKKLRRIVSNYRLGLVALLPIGACAYGPSEYEPCSTNKTCVEQNGEGWYCDTSLDWAICKQMEPLPDASYGPPPCSTDEECVEQNGVGWYCDTSNWPTCEQLGEDPNDYYGPPPCSTDEECVELNGAGWYCDKTGEWTSCQPEKDT